MKWDRTERYVAVLLQVFYILFTAHMLIFTVCLRYQEASNYVPFAETMWFFLFPYMMLASFLIGLPSVFLSLIFGDLSFYIIPGALAVLAAVWLFRGEWKWGKVIFFLCHIAHAGMICSYAPAILSV